MFALNYFKMLNLFRLDLDWLFLFTKFLTQKLTKAVVITIRFMQVTAILIADSLDSISLSFDVEVTSFTNRNSTNISTYLFAFSNNSFDDIASHKAIERLLPEFGRSTRKTILIRFNHLARTTPRLS